MRTIKYAHWGPWLVHMQVENEFIEYLEQAGKQLKQSHVKNLAGEIEKELLERLKKGTVNIYSNIHRLC